MSDARAALPPPGFNGLDCTRCSRQRHPPLTSPGGLRAAAETNDLDPIYVVAEFRWHLSVDEYAGQSEACDGPVACSAI